MSKKKKQAKKEAMKQQSPSAQRNMAGAYYGMPGAGYPVPVAPPARIIQLTPIIQPIAIVPFSTQQQPLAAFIDDDDVDF